LGRELRQERGQGEHVRGLIMSTARGKALTVSEEPSGRRETMKRWWIVPAGAGAALGWLVGFFFDKDLGRRRRHLAVDRTGGFLRRRRRQAARAGRLVGATAYGF